MRSASGRLGFRFILLILVLCIYSATGAVSSEGQPPHCDCDDVSVVSGSAAIDMVHCRSKGRLAAESECSLFLDTNTLRHQLLHKVLETIKERAHGLRQDSQSLQAQIADAVVHLRSVVVVSEQSSSSSSEMTSAAAAQAELHAGLAAMRAAVDAGMARVEASYRSQGDAVDRLREMRLQQDDVDGRQAKAMRRGQNDDDDDNLHGFKARAVEESRREIQHALDDLIRIHNLQSISIREAREELRAMHANISAALDKVLILVQYSARSYNITR